MSGSAPQARLDLDRWISGAMGAACFAGLLQLSTLVPSPAAGSLQWWAALNFTLGLPLALLGYILAMARKGALVRFAVASSWSRWLRQIVDGCVGLCALVTLCGAALVSCHLLDPTASLLGWPSWPYWVGLVVFWTIVGLMTLAERREHGRRKERMR